MRAPLATILSGEVLQPGEIVQLIIKPSRWFIILNSMLSCGFVVLIALGMQLVHWPIIVSTSSTIQIAVVLISGRVMWSALQWMGRYYILTDLRVIRLEGIFEVEINSILLRKVGGIKLYGYISERLLGKGTIEIASAELKPILWNTISRPKQVHEMLTAAVQKSQQNGHAH